MGTGAGCPTTGASPLLRCSGGCCMDGAARRLLLSRGGDSCRVPAARVPVRGGAGASRRGGSGAAESRSGPGSSACAPPACAGDSPAAAPVRGPCPSPRSAALPAPSAGLPPTLSSAVADFGSAASRLLASPRLRDGGVAATRGTGAASTSAPSSSAPSSASPPPSACSVPAAAATLAGAIGFTLPSDTAAVMGVAEAAVALLAMLPVA